MTYQPHSEALLMDCMDYMRQFPDKHFELAVVDPPYGITTLTPTSRIAKYGQLKMVNYAGVPDGYFEELFGVAITLLCRRHGVLFFGTKKIQSALMPTESLHGQALTKTLSAFTTNTSVLTGRIKTASTPPRSPSRYTPGFSKTTPNPAGKSWTHI